MPCKSQLVSKVRYNKLPEFRERSERKKKKKRGEHDARLSGGTKNYALTRDTVLRVISVRAAATKWGKKKNGRLLDDPLCVKTGRKMSFLRISLIKIRSERTKARHTLSSLNGVLISDGLPISADSLFFSEYPRCKSYAIFRSVNRDAADTHNKHNLTSKPGVRTMSNSSRLRALNQVDAHTRETNISKDQAAINAKYQRHARIWNSEIGDDLSIGSGASTRRAGCAAISGSVFSDRFATPFLALAAQRERGYSVDSLPSLASSSHPRSLGHPSHPILLLVLERDRHTRAREEQTRRERGRRLPNGY